MALHLSNFFAIESHIVTAGLKWAQDICQKAYTSTTMTNQKTSPIHTFHSAPVRLSTIIAQVQAKTRIKVPRNSASNSFFFIFINNKLYL